MAGLIRHVNFQPPALSPLSLWERVGVVRINQPNIASHLGLTGYGGTRCASGKIQGTVRIVLMIMSVFLTMLGMSWMLGMF